MTRTITAMFDSRSEAEAARDRLQASSIDAERINIVDQNTSGFSSDSYSTHENRGFWASLKNMFLPDEDRHIYEEGVRRGSFLLTAEVDEREADEAIAVLEDASTIDLEERQQMWRQEGWAGYQPAASTTSAPLTGTTTSRSGAVEEERIPLVEETLRVGKREVSRGGVRVRSYVVETPVHEQVNLREEHIDIERRPVGERVASADLRDSDLLRERNIELTETAEEAVVAKEAVVREEVVVRKTAEERVEDIDESVRRTEIDVDDDRGIDRLAANTTTPKRKDTDRLS